MSLKYKELCLAACELVGQVAEFISSQAGKVSHEEIEDKSWNSLVSYVDKTAEEMLVKGLGKLLPSATYVTEEETVNSEKSDLYWVIDPLDGTTNFLHQIPFYSTTIALVENGETVLGIVYGIPLNECFYAWKGSQAYLNGVEITVSTEQRFDKALTVIGFPYDKSIMDYYVEFLLHLAKFSRGLRRMGSAALDLAYVASGRFDAFFEYGLNAWDVTGGAFIVQQAGGKVSDFSGGGDYIFGRQIIASNPSLYPEFLTIVKEKFVIS